MNDDYAKRFTTEEQALQYERLYRLGRRDSMIWTLQRPVIRHHLKNIVAQRPQARALDFACGTGRVFGEVASIVHTVEGADLSPTMIELAKEKYPEATFIVGDILAQDCLGHESYDIVTAFRFILNAEPEISRNILARLHELLVPTAGWLIVNNHGNAFSLRHLALRAKSRNTGLENELSDYEVRNLLRSSGFLVEAVHGFGLLPDVVYRTPLAGVARFIDRLTANRRVFMPITIDRIYVARAF